MTHKRAGRVSAVHESFGSLRPRHIMVVAVAAFATGACTAGWSRHPVVVQLALIADTAPARWSGLTNIFFDSVPLGMRDSVRLGQSWTGVELADVVRGESLVTVYAARFKMRETGETHYVVDTAGGLNFETGPFLKFQQRNGLAVAGLGIEVRSHSGTRRSVPYQILRSDDGYTYARIANYLEGRARLGGHDYAVRVRSAGRNNPFYSLDQGTRFWIALDGGDSIAEQPGVTASGRALSSDEVLPGAPFLLAGRPYELADIDSAGSRLVLRPSAKQVAAAAGFVAPELTAHLVSGGRYRLADDRGKVVLVEFWSVDCHFSELARPRLNDLAARLRGAPFRWVGLAREDDSATVQRHLADHPMSATVALHDSAAWAIYDPGIATPLFYVIDEHGVVRFRAVGTSAVDAVAAKVAELLAPVPHRRAAH